MPVKLMNACMYMRVHVSKNGLVENVSIVLTCYILDRINIHPVASVT